jgi:HlyD family secretion protein
VNRQDSERRGHSLFCMIRYLILLLAFLATGCSEKLMVTTTQAETHRLEVSFTERAETVLRKDFPVSMPVTGRIERIDLEVGDRVSKGETLVRIDKVPALQEIEARQAAVNVTRSRQQLGFDTSVEQAEVRRAQRAVQTVRARSRQMNPLVVAARTGLDNAVAEQRRIQNLVRGGALPAQDEERALLAVEQAQATLAARKSERSALSQELAQAQAATASARAALQRKVEEARAQSSTIAEAEVRKEQAQYNLTKSAILSPISGQVLTRLERGPKELPAGSPLLTLGRLEDLEVECDVLSQDALRLARGTTVFLDAGAAYPENLKGEVRLKEPQGFTKRSSLGVEQQRVKVLISLKDPPDDLGSGYELWARFLVDQKTALTLPQSCFVRDKQGYFVWKLAGNKLERIVVEVGTKGDELWEVLNGVKSGDKVVLTPSDQLSEGLEVEVKP